MSLSVWEGGTRESITEEVTLEAVLERLRGVCHLVKWKSARHKESKDQRHEGEKERRVQYDWSLRR